MPDTANSQITVLPAPLDQSFEVVYSAGASIDEVKAAEDIARTAAEDYVITIAREHGYGVSIDHSHRNKAKRPNSIKHYVDIKCERGGFFCSPSHAPDRQPVQKSTGTRLTGCPFHVKLNLRASPGLFTL